MFEFLAFGAVATGVLYIQSRLGGKKDTTNKIDQFFRNAGIGVKERDKEGNPTGFQFPHYVGTRPHDWGITYVYQLPIGMTYKTINKTINLDEVFQAMFNRDVVVSEGTHNHIQIDVYNEKLPKEIPYDTKWLEQLKGYKVVIGIDNKKRLVIHDFDKIPHMIIGGMTRYGKSVVMKLLITQLVLKNQGVKFHLFDLKGGLAFNRFKKLPQVGGRVARDETESLRNLKRLKGEIKKRQLYFEEKGYEDIKEAWKNGECFDRDVIIIDEASVLAPKGKSDQLRNQCRDILEFIAQVSAGLGYNLIMCSQYPTSDILPRQVKQNSDARLSFRLRNTTASTVILDEPGAEDLPFEQPGRAIYSTDGKRVIQVPYMTNEVIDELISPLKKESEIFEHEQGETDGEGTSHIKDISEAGSSEQVPTTGNTFFRY